MFDKVLDISCKKATFLLVKNEEKKMSFLEKYQLKLHYKICTGCYYFRNQNLLISEHAKSAILSSEIKFSKEAKEKLKKNLKESMS